MTTLWLAAALLMQSSADSVPPTSEPPSDAVQAPVIEPRSGVVLRDAVRDALRRWARPEPEGEQAEVAAREFLVLFEELQQDDQLAKSVREPLLSKVRGRLMQLAAQIEKQTAIARRLADENRPPDIQRDRADDILPQIGGFGRGGLGHGFGQPGFGQPGFRGGFQGGGMMGGPMFGGGMMPGGRQAMPTDNGPQLVELIHRTISPPSWDVNGGPGTIYYWQPGRAMVVRQTQEVHEKMENLIEQLNRAGQ